MAVNFAVTSLLNQPAAFAVCTDPARSTTGASVSMSTDSAADGSETFPLASSALAVRACPPCGRAADVKLQAPPLPAVTVPIAAGLVPSKRRTVLPASAVPLSTRAVSLVTLSEFDAPLSLASARSIVGAPGFTVSVSTSSVSDASDVLPAASVALEVRVCAPSLSARPTVLFQVPPATAVTVSSSVAPS